MGYLIFKSVSTNSLIDPLNNNVANVYVSKMPDHRKAAMRNTEYYVKGRDGALHVEEGYQNFDLNVRLVLLKSSAAMRHIVNAWADGSGKLITSDDTTKAYQASVLDPIQWTRVAANGGYYDTADIIFNCQPMMVEAVDSVIELTASGTINNTTSAVAYPLIEVHGAGDVDFTFAGNEIHIEGMTANNPVKIDCENGYIWTLAGSATIRGEIPVLKIGENTITFGNNLTKLVVTPHWRWI